MKRKLVALILVLLPFWLLATTRSGAITRQVLIDGTVNTGASPGINGPDWETDEEFQGFSAAVNWYMTWDENNLYLGRVGGNNAEGSIIYLRAEYPGASFTPTPQAYDGLQPGLAPMGGVNFAAYFKFDGSIYDEFRTFSSGAWSAANTTLNPAFAFPSGVSHMEVAIPWNDITAGNGKPSNVRMVFYQVVPAGIACAQEFVYGESPWGTGNPGDGPNIGVNDGQPISARQPGGCDVGDSTAWRWWGCYPVIGGVGSNGWVALAPDAGPDDSICQTASAYIFQANQPPGTAQGTWTSISRPPGSPPVSFSNPNSPGSFVQNLTGFGIYTFTWNINYGGCPSLPDTIRITRLPAPPVALAWGDTTLPCDGDSAFLMGNDPNGANGTWSILAGSGNIQSPNDTSTWVTGLGPGTNQFMYTINNGVCPITSDVVTVYVPTSVQADAGQDFELCYASTITLQGNDPNQQQSTASGTWTQFSGENNLIFTNPFLHNTVISNMQPGEYTLVWTVSNPPCPSNSDTLRIINYNAPIADAGGDIVVCLGNDAELSGNDISILGDSSTAFWSQLSGPGPAQIMDSTLFNTQVQNLTLGTYTFIWEVSNGTCPVSTDGVRVTVIQLQDDGMDALVQPDSAASNGSATVSNPLNGNAPYLFSIDGMNFSASNTFSGLSTGSYLVTIVDANGCIDTLSFQLGYVPPIDSQPPVEDSLVIPTGFTPNGDGVNDTWVIDGLDNYPEAVVEVYNIWGGQVFRSVGKYLPWNGQRNGQGLPSANYYFIVDLKATGQSVRKGSLTILR